MQHMQRRLPTVFLPHGGGPCFFMDWTMGPPDTWDHLAEFLRTLPALLPEGVERIVVVSGHHEGDRVEITSAAKPELFFDYYGFPEHTYRLRYPAPGSPELAGRISRMLDDAGIANRLDAERGLDHGVFVPFLLAFPDADRPVVQVSLRDDLDARFHLELGRALAPLRDEGVLLVGSGMSYHNMAAFGSNRALADSEAFDRWLTEACTGPAHERARALAGWAGAPSARAAHPREEHLLPLLVAAGAAEGDPGRRIFTDVAMQARLSGFAFGDLAVPTPAGSQ